MYPAKRFFQTSTSIIQATTAIETIFNLFSHRYKGTLNRALTLRNFPRKSEEAEAVGMEEGTVVYLFMIEAILVYLE